MAEPLHPDTRVRIDRLVEKIAVSHELDPEIQDELRAHIEDKLLAYLSGEERITEEDAFILVREHFGDPGRVKVLLQDVHAAESGLGLARRLGAIAAVHIAFLGATALTETIAWMPMVWLHLAEFDFAHTSAVYNVMVAIAIVGCTYVYTWILLRWTRQIEAGKSLWFQRWNSRGIVAATGLLVCVYSLVPSTLFSFGAELGTFPVLAPPFAVVALNTVVVVGCAIWQAGLWLWWSDKRPRRRLNLVLAALAWLAMGAVPWSMLHVSQLRVGFYGSGSTDIALPGEAMLWQGHGQDYSISLGVRIRPIEQLLFPYFNSVILEHVFLLPLTFAAFAIVPATLFYLFVQRRRNRRIRP